jgi:hypothetical protein
MQELSHKRNLKRRIPFFDATSVKNIKNNQNLPRTFRNLDLEIALLQFAVLENASSCNKRMRFKIGGRRCSRRMAHSDPPPPSGARVACRTKLRILQISEFSDSKSLYGPNLRRRPRPLFASISDPGVIFSNLFHFFVRSENHQKSDLYQTLPKSQKSDPWVPKARFWIYFG